MSENQRRLIVVDHVRTPLEAAYKLLLTVVTLSPHNNNNNNINTASNLPAAFRSI